MKPIIVIEDSQKSISVDGVIDVSCEGKVFEKTVMIGSVMRGQILMGHGSLVKTAKNNISLNDFRGVAMNFAKAHSTVYVMIRGIARVVLHPDSTAGIIKNDLIASAGDGYVCRLWEFDTHLSIGKAIAVYDKYIDVKIDC